MTHTTVKYDIKLMSDGEPGTGLGGETQNSLSPRNHCGDLVIRESHLKGLLRETLVRIETERGWQSRLSVRLFGETDQLDVESDAMLSFLPARTRNRTTSKVTRTAVSGHGVGKNSTLRTSEAVGCGTQFASALHGRFEAGSVEDLATRLAMLSLPAIGGNRTRGSGLVRISIEGETRTPGSLLRDLDKIFSAQTEFLSSKPKSNEQVVTLAVKCCVVELFFKAESPICCPELPDKTNVIATGFTIPASAVQGALLTRLNYLNPKLADELFKHPGFRAWPLQPCAQSIGTDWPELDMLPSSLRVSLTHRAAKYSIDDDVPTDFRDIALDGQYTEQMTAVSGAPLKASDGVLLVKPMGGRELWKANDMSHLITAHGVRNSREGFANPNRATDESDRDRRNLFVVDAMSPMIWRGMVVMPKDAASALIADLDKNPNLALGKGRTVRGIGQLKARIVDDGNTASVWETTTDRTVLIVQSPIAIKGMTARDTAQDCLRGEVQRWMDCIGCKVDIDDCWAKGGILFGWSRKEKSKRQSALPVILPGSVVAFKEKIPAEVLMRLYLPSSDGTMAVEIPNRDRGFGAVSVHPGKATNFRKSKSELPNFGNQELADAIKLVLQIDFRSGSLPSISQIREVQNRIRSNTQEAISYLKERCESTPRVWAVWQGVKIQVIKVLEDNNENKDVARRALDVLADLVHYHSKKENR